MSSLKTTAKDQIHLEKLIVKQKLSGFDGKESPVPEALEEKFGTMPNREELLSLAKVISKHLQIPLDREAYRRKNVLMKWYHDNFGQILPFIQNNIVVEKEQRRRPKRKQ